MTGKEFFRKTFSGYLWGNCLGMLVLAALLMWGVVWFLDEYTHHGENVTVPSVVGKNVRAVESQFEEMGLQLVVVDTGYVKTLPADIILQGWAADSRYRERGSCSDACPPRLG